jgi:hypothetical protein
MYAFIYSSSSSSSSSPKYIVSMSSFTCSFTGLVMVLCLANPYLILSSGNGQSLTKNVHSINEFNVHVHDLLVLESCLQIEFLIHVLLYDCNCSSRM